MTREEVIKRAYKRVDLHEDTLLKEIIDEIYEEWENEYFELHDKFAKYLDYTTQSKCSKPEVELKFLKNCFDSNQN
jgi:hypothetical protein